MAFLNATNPATIKLVRKRHGRLGYKAQRLATDLLKRLGLIQKQTANRRHAGHRADQGAGDPLHQQEDAGGLPKKTARALLDIEDKDYVPIIRDPQRSPRPRPRRCSTSPAAAPSACSARWAWPRRPCSGIGVQTVLPPGYLCCGYPQRGSGQFDKAEKIITDNRVLFHRVANTLNYLDIKTVVVLRHLLRPAAGLRVRARSSPAAASSTSTNTCWKRASR
jgi:hypothetical protein